jgi:hypothetical protein
MPEEHDVVIRANAGLSHREFNPLLIISAFTGQ